MHFIPARTDLADLDEKVEWALAHPDALAIASRARELYARLRSPGHAQRSLANNVAAMIDAREAAAEQRLVEKAGGGKD